jgi:hypothetical protein
MAATVVRYHVAKLDSENHPSTQLEDTITQVPRVGFPLLGEFSISRARRRQCAENHLAFWQSTDTHRKCLSSLITYAKMLSLGERGCCNILHNFGSQHVTNSHILVERIELNSNHNRLKHS